jgi:hypothetical protein
VGAGLTAAIVKVVEEIVPAIPDATCECGRFGVVLFGVRLFCPATRCGLFGKLLGLCECD